LRKKLRVRLFLLFTLGQESLFVLLVLVLVFIDNNKTKEGIFTPFKVQCKSHI